MTATRPARLRLRVTVGDSWTPVAVDASPDDTVAALKARVLSAARIPVEAATLYELKYGGALVEEARTLGALGVPDGAGLVVLARRRRPVR